MHHSDEIIGLAFSNGDPTPTQELRRLHEAASLFIKERPHAYVRAFISPAVKYLVIEKRTFVDWFAGVLRNDEILYSKFDIPRREPGDNTPPNPHYLDRQQLVEALRAYEAPLRALKGITGRFADVDMPAAEQKAMRFLAAGIVRDDQGGMLSQRAIAAFGEMFGRNLSCQTPHNLNFLLHYARRGATHGLRFASLRAFQWVACSHNSLNTSAFRQRLFGLAEAEQTSWVRCQAAQIVDSALRHSSAAARPRHTARPAAQAGMEARV